MKDKSTSSPKWREDFPIEQEFDDFVTRRDFIRFLGLVSAGLAVGSGSVAVNSLTHTEAETLPELAVAGADTLKPGSWLVFNYPDEHSPAMLIRREDGEYAAYLQKCPHLSCPVSYHAAGSDGEPEGLRCHCHNGRFDLDTGKGTAGPPRELRPLRRVELRVEADGRVAAVGLAKRHKG